MTTGRGEAAGRRRRAAALCGGLLVAGWLASGLRVLDPATQFGVLEGVFPGLPRAVVGRRIVLAPPGLLRLAVFPIGPTDRTLPDASQAQLPSADGSRFGLKGSIRLRALPARAADLARSPARSGLDGVVLAAVRAAGEELESAQPGERTVPTRVGAFDERLRRELEARGVEVEKIDLAGFDYLASAAPTGPVPPDARVLLVGLDGADWQIIDPLIEQGRMPHLAKLAREGVRARLLTITPTLSPVIWTSIATGVEPGRHGVFDFLKNTSGGVSEPVTSKERRVPAVWEMLSGAGVPVAVTGWWATWPADPVLGTIVTDRLAYQLFGFSSDPRSAEGKTWPPALYDTIRPLIVPPDAVPWSDVAPYLTGPRSERAQFDAGERELLDELRTLLASGRTYLAAALAQRNVSRDRFEAVYFEGTDTVGHLFMPYRPPLLAGVDAARFASFREVVDRYYETADGILGRLLEGRDGWTVLVLSDHGFTSDETRPRTTDSRIGHGAAADWHRRFGILVLSGPGVKRGGRLEEASVYDIAPTILALFGQPVPRSWPGRVLGEAMTPVWLSEHPVLFRGDEPRRTAIAPAAPAGGGDDPEAQELREKLQSLGYVASDASGSMTTKNNRGVALLAAGEYGPAAEEFRRAIDLAPEQATLWVNLGIALRLAGAKDEARAWLLKAFERPEAARAAGMQLSQLDMDAGDLAGSERVLRKVLAREPGAPEARNSLGLVLEAKGDLASAAREYQEAARLDPSAAEPRNNLGNLDKRGGRPAEAERHYQEAIAADPYFMGAYNNLGLLYQERGDRARAIDLYGRALMKSPKNAIVMNNLASLYFAGGDLEAARSFWRKAVAADAAYPSPWNNLAGLALSEGQLDEAERCLDRALALDRAYGDAHINRALLLARKGDVPGARGELAAAARDPRAEVAARIQLGLLELGQDRPRFAVQALEQARRRGGERPEILNPLGEAYGRLGERAKALELWHASLRIDPAQPRLVDAVAKLEAR